MKPSSMVFVFTRGGGPTYYSDLKPLSSSRRKKMEKIRTKTGYLGAKQAQRSANA